MRKEINDSDNIIWLLPTGYSTALLGSLASMAQASYQTRTHENYTTQPMLGVLIFPKFGGSGSPMWVGIRGVKRGVI